MCKSATTTNNFRRPRRAARAFFALALPLVFAASPAPARAQIFSDDVAREQAVRNAAQLEDLIRIVENLRDRLGAMEQQRQATDRRLRELAGRIEELAAVAESAGKDEMKTLSASVSRGASERGELAGGLAALQEEFAEIRQFIQLPPEQDFYESAFADYQSENYAQAAAGFEKTLKYYPEGKFNANARYWMSRSFLEMGEYEPAAEAARRLIALPGDGDKIPDAMLVLAQAQKKLRRDKESRATLEALIAAHPTTLAADRARQLLSP